MMDMSKKIKLATICAVMSVSYFMTYFICLVAYSVHDLEVSPHGLAGLVIILTMKFNREKATIDQYVNLAEDRAKRTFAVFIVVLFIHAIYSG